MKVANDDPTFTVRIWNNKHMVSGNTGTVDKDAMNNIS